MVLYHATYAAYLPSILEKGLGAETPCKNWSDSKPGHVYLATDKEYARDFAEAAELVSDEVYDTGIVVFKVNCDGLDLKPDSCVLRDPGEEVQSFEFEGIVPPERLEICK